MTAPEQLGPQTVTFRGRDSSNPVPVVATDLNTIPEVEPNDTPATATRVTPPCGINGRIGAKRDLDHFVFAAKKGQRYMIAAQAAELHSPADVYLTLRTILGAEVARSDPHREPRIDFIASSPWQDAQLLVALPAGSAPSRST